MARHGPPWGASAGPSQRARASGLASFASGGVPGVANGGLQGLVPLSSVPGERGPATAVLARSGHAPCSCGFYPGLPRLRSGRAVGSIGLGALSVAISQVSTAGARTALGDRPHDEALAAAHVAAREHTRLVGHERGVARRCRARRARRPAARAARRARGRGSPSRAARARTAARSRCLRSSRTAVDHLDLVGAGRARCRRRRRGSTRCSRCRRARHLPRAPTTRGRCSTTSATGWWAPGVGRPGQDLELVHRRRALAVHGAEAVGTGVATTDDHDVLARRGDRRLGEVALLHPVCRAAGTPSPGGCRRAHGPGIGRSRHAVAPPASTIASNSARSSSR